MLGFKAKKILLFILIILSSCNKRPPNEFQVKNTLKNIYCYELLIDEIKNNKNLDSLILNIRNQKLKGDFDPITVKPEYRLISSNELLKTLPIDFKNKCYSKLDSTNSFRGIRYINQNKIIIEVNKFKKNNLLKPIYRYSKVKNIEFHRIIISDEKLNKNDYQFKNENLSFKKGVKKNWSYEVSQLQL